MEIGNYLGTVITVYHKIIIYLSMTLTLIFVRIFYDYLFALNYI